MRLNFIISYASQYATSLIRQLREDGVYMRPLGNVIYLMCGPCTSLDICTHQLNKVYERILAFDSKKEELALDISNARAPQCMSVN